MFPSLLRARMGGILDLSDARIAALQKHHELLLRWNKTLNLTRIDSLEEAVERHYCESLFLAAHLPCGPLKIADVGSGAGFPGFPVAIARADCQVTLIESHQRKAVFLREASRIAPNVRVLAIRAEDCLEVFDHMISRAVSYEDLAKVELAGNYGLLTGLEPPLANAGIIWKDPIMLPWGRQRFLRIGYSPESLLTP